MPSCSPRGGRATSSTAWCGPTAPSMLDGHGLAASLDWHARNLSKRTVIAIAVRGIESALRPALEVEIALFRIAQEALNNVAKHARAQHVEIALVHANGECVMSV